MPFCPAREENAESAMPTDTQQAFTEHFVRSQHRVYGYIVTLLPRRADADEAFQDTCLILWGKWTEFDLSRDFTRWACGIAHNVVRNFKRRQRPGAITLNEDLLAQIADVGLENEPVLEARRRALLLCLEKLPAARRELVERSYLRGEVIRNVAEQIGLTPAALYLQLQRIRRSLFECVDRALRAQGGR